MGCGHDRRAELIHLHAAVVDVELPGDIRTRCSQNARNGITDGRPAGVAKV